MKSRVLKFVFLMKVSQVYSLMIFSKKFKILSIYLKKNRVNDLHFLLNLIIVKE